MTSPTPPEVTFDDDERHALLTLAGITGYLAAAANHATVAEIGRLPAEMQDPGIRAVNRIRALEGHDPLTLDEDIPFGEEEIDISGCQVFDP